MVRGGLLEEATFELSWVDKKLPFMGSAGQGTLGRRKSQCKGPEAGTCLVCLSNSRRPVQKMRAEKGQGRLFGTLWAVVRNVFLFFEGWWHK